LLYSAVGHVLGAAEIAKLPLKLNLSSSPYIHTRTFTHCWYFLFL